MHQQEYYGHIFWYAQLQQEICHSQLEHKENDETQDGRKVQLYM